MFYKWDAACVYLFYLICFTLCYLSSGRFNTFRTCNTNTSGPGHLFTWSPSTASAKPYCCQLGCPLTFRALLIICGIDSLSCWKHLVHVNMIHSCDLPVPPRPEGSLLDGDLVPVEARLSCRTWSIILLQAAVSRCEH